MKNVERAAITIDGNGAARVHVWLRFKAEQFKMEGGSEFSFRIGADTYIKYLIGRLEKYWQNVEFDCGQRLGIPDRPGWCRTRIMVFNCKNPWQPN
jgi:hypothetical protein